MSPSKPSRLLVSTLFLVVAVAPWRGAAAQSTGVVAGTVAAAEGGAAVAGATVTIEGATIEGANLTATTNGLGRFRIAGVSAGTVSVITRAPGFLEQRVDAVEVRGNGSVTLEIELAVTPNFMDRVQVTATRAPTGIGELPAQADIVDREVIDRRNDQQLTSAVAHIPGLVVSTQAGSFESVTLRGLPRDGNEFTTTLLLIDGVPQTDSRNSARVVNVPINDAASIEVLRGPNSALYGRTAIGGTINLLTAEPSPTHHLRADLTAGDFDTTKGMAAVSGPLRDWGGYYLSGSTERNHGYFTGPIDYQVERASLFGKLTLTPDARSFAKLSVNTVESDQSTPTNVPIIGGRFLSDIDPRFDRLSNLNVPGTNYHQEEDRLTGTYSRLFAGKVNLVALFGYRQIQYKFIDDGDVIGAPYDLAANTLTMYPFDQETNEDIAYSELRLELVPGPGDSSLIVGGSFESTRGFSAGNLIYTDPDTFGWPLNYLDGVHPPRSEWNFFRFGGNDYGQDGTGLFGQYLIEPARRLQVTAGGRYDHFALDNILTFSAGRPRIEDSFHAFSPKLGVTYQLFDGGSSDVRVYGQYAEAFLPPRRPSQLRPSNTAVELQPEDVRNVEVGVKANALGSRLFVQGAYFRMSRDGIITTVRQGPFFLPSNAGEHEYEGVEAEVRWSAPGVVSAYFNAALYDNRFGRFVIQSSGGDTVLTGNRLPIAPDRVLNGGFSVSPHRRIGVEVNVKHIGRVAIDQGNTFELDAYTLVDAAISWSRGPLRLTLSGHNLFDEEYFGNGDTSLAESADPGRPRQVLLTASFQASSTRR